MTQDGKKTLGTVVGQQIHDHWPQQIPRTFAPYSLMVITLVLGGGLVTALVAGAAEVYEWVRESSGATGVDQSILDQMLLLRSPEAERAITWFTNLGGTIGMTILAIVAVILLSWSSRSWRALILVASAAAGSLTMTIVGKRLIGRERPSLEDAVPPYEHSASFPSGHTLNATAILTVVAYLVFIEFTKSWQRILAIALCGFFVIAMGTSRIYLGHHWFSDVLAAFLLGLAWAAVVILAHRLWWAVKERRNGNGAHRPQADG